MDPVSAFALQVVLGGALVYGVYWVIHKAVAGGRVDARQTLNRDAPDLRASAQARRD